MQGFCKWFKSDKGYGFLVAQTGEEVFVHWRDIQMDGYKSLNDGDTVDFQIAPNGDGRTKAVNVKIVQGDNDA